MHRPMFYVTWKVSGVEKEEEEEEEEEEEKEE